MRSFITSRSPSGPRNCFANCRISTSVVESITTLPAPWLATTCALVKEALCSSIRMRKMNTYSSVAIHTPTLPASVMVSMADAEAVTPSSEHTEVMRPFMKSRSEMAS